MFICQGHWKKKISVMYLGSLFFNENKENWQLQSTLIIADTLGTSFSVRISESP